MSSKIRYVAVTEWPERLAVNTDGILIEDLELAGFRDREPHKEVFLRGHRGELNTPGHARWLWKQRGKFPREWRTRVLTFEGSLFRRAGDASGQLFMVGIWFAHDSKRWRKGFIEFEPYYHPH